MFHARLLLLCLLAAAARAQVPVAARAATPPGAALSAAAPAKLVFHFEHAGMAVPAYTFTLLDSGEGTYSEADGAATTPLHLMQTTYGQIFEQVRTPGAFRGCNSRERNLANTGIKSLSYSSATGSQACTYNYSDSKIITALTEAFESMEYVMETGQRLDHLHRFDRLGLDQEMHALVAAAKDGRTAGLANIAPVLRSLIDDPLVLERVRASAVKLLEQASLGK